MDKLDCLPAVLRGLVIVKTHDERERRHPVILIERLDAVLDYPMPLLWSVRRELPIRNLPMSLMLPVSKPHWIPMWLSGLDLIIFETLGMSLSSAIAPARVPCVGFVCSMPVAIMPLNSSSIASLFGCMFLVVLGFRPYTKMSSLWTQA